MDQYPQQGIIKRRMQKGCCSKLGYIRYRHEGE